MDRRVASYLDHAGRELDRGRGDVAEGLEGEALRAAERLPDGRGERAAVLAFRARRLRAADDLEGALRATAEARALTDAPAATLDLRLEEAQLRLALGESGVRATVEALVAEGGAPWAMARAQALLARACEAEGDVEAARRAEAAGRRLLAGGPPPPRELAEALGIAPQPPPAAPASRAGRGPGPPPRATARPDAAPRGGGSGATGGPGPRVPGSGTGGGERADRARWDRGAHRGPEPPATAGTTASRTVDETAYAAALADLDALVGLADVKRQVHRTAQLLRMRALREAAGLRVADVSLHLVFCGGPGTGKTTVARLYGRLYHALGLLGSDRLVEVDRSGLVSGYVGQTATRVNEVVDSALDGVLFVDEAYALAGRGPGDFGPEAIATLLKRMEDDRDRLAVICAGYTREMEAFLASNSGLASRFAETVTFPDYLPAELVEILERFCAAHDYQLDGAALARASEALRGWHAARDETFANARTVRNLFDDVIAAQADRLLSAGPRGQDIDPEEMRRLRRADVDAALAP